MKYYIMAGEASGDLHGSNLIKGLLETDPQAELRFWGGDLMQQAAGEHGTLIKHYNENSAMGFVEIIMSLGRIARLLKFCRRDIEDFRPDAVIFIDYPGFNLRIAKHVKKLGIPTFYYIAPKVWAWKEWRVKQIRKRVDRLFVIFPFEVEYFRNHGIDTYYAGNPLMDSIETRARDLGTYEAFAAKNGLDPHRPMVALVPGSRSHEIRFNLPQMVSAARSFPDYQFVVTGVDWLPEALYHKYTADSPVKIIYNQTYQAMAHASAALVTSGTATLEAGLLGLRQVVCFRASALTIWIVSKLIKVRYVSLVNLIMDREVVKELLQGGFTGEATIRELRQILPGGTHAERMDRDYQELRQRVGASGASQRVAHQMVKILRKEV